MTFTTFIIHPTPMKYQFGGMKFMIFWFFRKMTGVMSGL